MENQLSSISRFVFVVALVCVAIGIAQRVAFAFDYELLGGSVTGGRLFEIAAMLMVFVIAVLLRQIRDLLRARVT